MAAEQKKLLAKSVHFYAGVELMGGKTSISSKESDIEVHDWGIRAVSKKSKKTYRVFGSNIKGIEEMPESGEAAPLLRKR